MQSTDANWIVMWNDFVMFTLKVSGNAQVRTLLASYDITETPQCFNQPVSGDITGQFHCSQR